MKKEHKAKGLRSIVVFIPTIITISILYVLILVSTILINVDTTNMTDTNEKVTDCVETVTNLQSGSSKLSATAISFAHQPTFPDPAKTLNTNALGAYISEFTNQEKRPNVILENLKKYNLDDETWKLLNEIAIDVDSMITAQAHSFRLINTISYVTIPTDILNQLPNFTLLESEISKDDDVKLKDALEILLNRDYSTHQQNVSDKVKEVTNIITSTALEKSADITFRIKLMRGFLWGSILLILISNLALFIILLKKLVFPITKFSKRIDNNERLETEHALYEANHLAIAYNSLLDRHKEFENELRTVAEIDSLTKLPNRYCYNEFLKKIPEEEKSVCVFLFDINNLKYVNDTFGHSKGDELIKNASLCIKECFLDTKGKNCYRIGGDEFVATLDNITKENIDDYIQAFQDRQKELNVSIAMGYAYTDNIKNVGYEKLIIRADKNMYKNKKEIHEKQNESESLYC
ncbi:MAG: GGDEF domain-containing protein [Acholeplasmatales bacterium]|nr:GGDEF domain-containing protein [Acholeplasmatales bacterium]